MKRTLMLSILLAVLLVFSFSAAVLAAEPMTITVETKADAVQVGDEVSLAVSIAGNPGFTNYEWTLEYDEVSLEVKKVENKLNGLFETREEIGRVNIGLIAANPISEDGTAFVVTFLVKQGAAEGLSEVKISSKKLANVPENVEAIDAQYIAGGVTIASTTGNPTTGKPTTGNPTTGNPTTGKPTTGKPTTGEPTTGAIKVRDIEVGTENYSVTGRTVTVTYPIACKLGYLEGDKYVTITPTENGDGSYSFEVPAGIEEVLLVIKGDTNGDGEITTADAVKAQAAFLGHEVSAESAFAAEVTGDGEITTADAVQIQAVFLEKHTFEW